MSCQKSKNQNFEYNWRIQEIIDDITENSEETENDKSASHDYPFFRGYFWGVFGVFFAHKRAQNRDPGIGMR